MNDLKQEIVLIARQEGFDVVGVSRPEINKSSEFLNWLDKGYFGGMEYMCRNIEKRLEPVKLMKGVRSIICFGVSYYQPIVLPVENDENYRLGRVAMYAWGHDYHVVLKRKLHSLAKRIKEILGREFRYRAFVDSAPVLETNLAWQAGLGWIGRNGCLVNKRLGSFLFLCELFVDFELPADEPGKNYCGKCTKCIEACPVGAIVESGIVDARKCVSYLTIEYNGQISKEQKKIIGNWIFGCDACQEVCPFNKRAKQTQIREFREHILGPVMNVDEILSWNDYDYKHRTRESPGARANLSQWKRNAQIVAENLSYI